MKLVRKLTSSRMSRVGWGLAVLALAGAMALSFVFAYSSVGDQQRAAQARAVGDTTKKPLSELTAAQVSKPIQGDAYKVLLKDVRDHVMKDDRVLRVRIFNLNGQLVFSTDAGDKIGVAQIGSPQFQTGSSGGVASVITEPEAAVPSALAGSSERLYVTFAALRLQSQPKAAAVVEVDQRYSAIEAAAYQLWRPIQLGIGVLILVALLMLVVSVLASRAPRRFETPPKVGAQPGQGFAQGGSTRVQKELEKRLEAVEESLRTAEQRVAASDREKRQIAERLVSAHEQLELMTAAAKSPKPAKGGDEAVARRAAALEAERDRMAAEVTRLEGELEERGSAPVGEGGGTPSSADEKVQGRVAELEAALADANAKAASLESAARQFEEERKVASAELDRAKEEIAGQKGRKVSKSKDGGSRAEAAAQAKAEERAQQAEERAQQAEELTRQAEDKAREADEKLAQALERAGQAEEHARQAQERSSESDQRAGQATEQLVQANARMEQLEAGSEEVERRAAAAEQRVGQLEAVTKQAEERMTQLEGGQRQAEQRAAQADVRLREIEQERTKLSTELERVNGSLVAKEKELAAKAEREGKASELAARVEELEAQRRQDVSELQRVQEALANTQLELAAATKRAKQAESSARTLKAVEDVAEPPAEEAPDDSLETIAARLSRARGRKRAVEPEETEAPALEEPEAPAPEEPDTGAPAVGLSLRERLARAAAARHRVPGSEDEAEER
jgi:chromosome segregation ATPase